MNPGHRQNRNLRIRELRYQKKHHFGSAGGANSAQDRLRQKFETKNENSPKKSWHAKNPLMVESTVVETRSIIEAKISPSIPSSINSQTQSFKLEFHPEARAGKVPAWLLYAGAMISISLLISLLDSQILLANAAEIKNKRGKKSSSGFDEEVSPKAARTFTGKSAPDLSTRKNKFGTVVVENINAAKQRELEENTLPMSSYKAITNQLGICVIKQNIFSQYPMCETLTAKSVEDDLDRAEIIVYQLITGLVLDPNMETIKKLRIPFTPPFPRTPDFQVKKFKESIARQLSHASEPAKRVANYYLKESMHFGLFYVSPYYKIVEGKSTKPSAAFYGSKTVTHFYATTFGIKDEVHEFAHAGAFSLGWGSQPVTSSAEYIKYPPCHISEFMRTTQEEIDILINMRNRLLNNTVSLSSNDDAAIEHFLQIIAGHDVPIYYLIDDRYGPNFEKHLGLSVQLNHELTPIGKPTTPPWKLKYVTNEFYYECAKEIFAGRVKIVEVNYNVELLPGLANVIMVPESQNLELKWRSFFSWLDDKLIDYGMSIKSSDPKIQATSYCQERFAVLHELSDYILRNLMPKTYDLLHKIYDQYDESQRPAYKM